MIGHITYADGAPCPTLVLDARSLPREEPALLAALARARRHLDRAGHGHVLKIALIEPSPQPMFDLDYRFIQALPDSPDHFDLRGSCGHSMLGAAMASPAFRMAPQLARGRRTRVNVLNNGDRVVCETEEVSGGTADFTVCYRYTPPKAVDRLLLTGEPRTTLDVDGQVTVSLVSTGNPYVFVDAVTVGAPTVTGLFAAGPELLDRLVRIRMAAAALLGWPAGGAFPKVAAVLPDGSGGIAVRAVSVPSWHPTLALTGSVCLAAASRIAGTIPWLAARAGGADAAASVHTPGGRWPVSVTTAVHAGVPHLAEVSIGRRRVTSYGAIRIQLPARLQPEEVVAGWPLSA
jgi:2-methylaconitate cis-trans-isomerase PrpF